MGEAFELKTLSREAIPAALEKAQRYRLLNDPNEAESICLDILEVEPENEQALILLLLALTDQFGDAAGAAVKSASALLPRLQDEYDRAYYTGIIYERKARAILARRTPGCESHAYEWLRDAMDEFEKAEAIHPPGNDDAILRWNTCARIIMNHGLSCRQEDKVHYLLE